MPVHRVADDALEALVDALPRNGERLVTLVSVADGLAWVVVTDRLARTGKETR